MSSSPYVFVLLLLSALISASCQRDAQDGARLPRASTRPTSATSQATTKTSQATTTLQLPRDHAARCQAAVQKYTHCMEAAYRLAKQQEQHLPPAEAARTKPLLEKMAAALRDPQREEKLRATCLKSPIRRAWLRCILQSPCDQLHSCRKKHLPSP